MSEQAFFYLQGILAAAAIGHVEVTNHSFAAFINKKRVPRDSSALHRCIARENFSINVTQDHRRRAAVVPGELLRPHFRLIILQGTKISRSKVSEIENFHGAPEPFDASQAFRKRRPRWECSA